MVRVSRRRWRSGRGGEEYRKGRRVDARCFWVVRGPSNEIVAVYTEKEAAEEKARQVPGAKVRYECEFFVEERGWWR